jgi:dihydrofolate reductase
MRKVIVSMNVTLDGFISGPDRELDWHFRSWSKEMSASATEQLSKADTILLGRVTYRAMARYWPAAMRDLDFPKSDIEFAYMMNNYAKVVFSRTLTTPEWYNSRLVAGDIVNEIECLKRQPGKDMITYGSGRVVSALMRSGLVDEYRIWVHPVLLGNGTPLFSDLPEKLNMKLFDTKAFGSGVVILYYRPGPQSTASPFRI